MKICNKCRINKSTDDFVKDRTKKDGIRNYCKGCHQKKMKAERTSNPVKHREIAIKSYRKHFSDNRVKKNERNRTKYHNDDSFKKSKLDKCAKRYLSNRNVKCQQCKCDLPKHRIKWCDSCRPAQGEYVKKWIAKVGKKHVNNLQNIRVKKKVENLTDGYIAGQIRAKKYPGWRIEEIPRELIELKRCVIKLKREIKYKTQ